LGVIIKIIKMRVAVQIIRVANLREANPKVISQIIIVIVIAIGIVIVIAIKIMRTGTLTIIRNQMRTSKTAITRMLMQIKTTTAVRIIALTTAEVKATQATLHHRLISQHPAIKNSFY